MEGRAPNRETAHTRHWNLYLQRVASAVEPSFHAKSGHGRRVADQVDDRLMVVQRPAAPVLRDMRKEPMLDLVPLARARRHVTDVHAQARVVCELLKLRLPK